jgi:hypothetical protein
MGLGNKQPHVSFLVEPVLDQNSPKPDKKWLKGVNHFFRNLFYWKTLKIVIFGVTHEVQQALLHKSWKKTEKWKTQR